MASVQSANLARSPTRRGGLRRLLRVATKERGSSRSKLEEAGGMRTAAVASMIALTTSCGTSDNSLDVGGDDAGRISFMTGDAAGPQNLGAYIEQGTVAVKLITLSCAGDCATVQAVGTGGHPPYTYAWEDGSTDAVRRVCPTADTGYSVKVTDTGESGEVSRPPQTAKASVTADVLACPDGGAHPGGNADGGIANCETFLILGGPSGEVSGTGAMACGDSGTPGALQWGVGPALGSAVSLEAGQSYEIVEHVTGTLLLGSPPLWDFYGSAATCTAPPGGELLGSMTFDPSVPRQSFCFRPKAGYTAIDLYTSAIAAGTGEGVYQICRGCDQPDASN
jgi:hypothetical protein